MISVIFNNWKKKIANCDRLLKKELLKVKICIKDLILKSAFACFADRCPYFVLRGSMLHDRRLCVLLNRDN